MSWLQKLKTKTNATNKIAPTGSQNELAAGGTAASKPGSAAGSTKDLSATNASPNSSAPSSSPTPGAAASTSSCKSSATALPGKDVSGLLIIRVLEGKDVAIRGDGPAGSPTTLGSPGSSTSLQYLPYIVLAYDKNEVVVNATSGSMVAPVWRSRATFDLTHDADLIVHLFLRSPNQNQPHGTPEQHDQAGAAAAAGAVPGSMPTDLHLGSMVIEANALPTTEANGQRDLWLPMKLPSSGSSTALVHVQLSYKPPSKQAQSISIDDFDLLKVIGKGNTGRIYALKILKKSHIVSREEVTHTLSERNVLSRLRHPFIVNLKFSFQTPQKLYWEGRFSEDRARFYAADYDIIYRDLKPENILLDYQGHIALCDFGLCKLNMGGGARTNTFCGTPEYLACEVLLGNGYNQTVDWWTLGILVFEMLTGLPPFYDENLNEMYRKILYLPLHFPAYLSPAAKSLLTGLLDRDPEKRLGARGPAEVKSHPFFASIDWQALIEKRVVPPFKPSVENAFDTSNFDEEFTREVPMDSVVNESVLSQTVQGQFAGFTYIPAIRFVSAGGAMAVPMGSTFQGGSSVMGNASGHGN
ncbi:kinase-like domain-containing protein [Catenaria anguillulae PL171]|uniref:Kinase-like domain-containing protein n=1 Tax=Catenaria anguillulae PL171 TaxID=765915 RepID=A0A1Y2I358_9FUNG|nr:kinase-like domain-containing protein [Catenaria anguillulae PL171]